MLRGQGFWTNKSVRAFAQTQDPVELVTQRARAIVLQAIEAGWSGPPHDPFELARLLRIRTFPREDVAEARTVPLGRDNYQIEYNPARPRGRVRFSICHEISHTLFPDFLERVRHRATHRELTGDDWQLEMLCNIAAAEFLMPFTSLPSLDDEEQLSLRHLLELRAQFDVSTEALLLRAVKSTCVSVLLFSASRVEVGPHKGRYQIDYSVPSRACESFLPSGALLPSKSVVAECTAIGYSARGDEEWPRLPDRARIECVGIPPYPEHAYPRILGLARSANPRHDPSLVINYLYGDATDPRGKGFRIIAHVVNDKAAVWGAGFGKFVRNKWPQVQDAFRKWAKASPEKFTLGSVHMTAIDSSTAIVHMVSQHGYGPSPKPRIRYAALKRCLQQLAETATHHSASVHMPRIGSGHAGGDWSIIHELIDETLCRKGIPVTVYDLPPAPPTHIRMLLESWA